MDFRSSQTISPISLFDFIHQNSYLTDLQLTANSAAISHIS